MVSLCCWHWQVYKKDLQLHDLKSKIKQLKKENAERAAAQAKGRPGGPRESGSFPSLGRMMSFAKADGDSPVPAAPQRKSEASPFPSMVI